jgi:hypothetical protein
MIAVDRVDYIADLNPGVTGFLRQSRGCDNAEAALMKLVQTWAT